MTKNPHLQKCTGAEWKQKGTPQKNQKKIKPNQKTTTTGITNQLTKTETLQIFLLWQTFKANYFVDALHHRLPKIRARRETSTEPPDNQDLLFYPP